MKILHKISLNSISKNLSVFFAIFALLGNVSVSQIVRDGILPSLKYHLNDKAPVTTIYVPFSVDKLKAEDAQFGKSSGRPPRAGISLPVGLNTAEFGEWTRLPSGRMLWRATLEAKGATALGVVFDMFNLPHDAELYLYNHDMSMVNGALDSQNNNPAQVLSTKVLYGSSITIEYIETPASEFHEAQYKPMGLLNIGEVMYMYTDVYQTFDYSKPNTGTSAACQVDVNCAVGNNWQDQKRGVAHNLFRIGSNWFYCSGSLVNNTNEDFTPYYLTAFHCGDGASVADRNVWQFYFNYERPNCGSGAPPTSDMLSGCQLRAFGPLAGGSDLLLVQLNNSVPLSYNPFFNGWNRVDVGATSGAGIHHPNGDVKKISTFTSTLTSATPNVSGSVMATNSAWRVVWSSNESGWGVTQGGSSGSPIFNQNGLVVGSLTGGSSSCTNQSSPDFYGKFSYHWESNGISMDRQLRPWLDPAGTNPTTLRGWDPRWANINVAPVTEFQATATGTTAVSLSWKKNASNDNVLIVWSATNTFGAPAQGVQYSPGQTLPGAGGTILYAGVGTNTLHSSLQPATIYHYRAYSYNASFEYSLSSAASATTHCPIYTPTFTEGFEGGTIPMCWSQQHHTGTINWTLLSGSAQSGTFSARFNGTAWGQSTRLITPQISFLGYSAATLTFWERRIEAGQGVNATRDQLRVEYWDGNAWVEVWSNTATADPWVQRTVTLPAAALIEVGRIAFRAVASSNNATTTQIDNITITASGQVLFANFSATPLTAIVGEPVTFTDSSGGGTITSWGWNFGAGAVPATVTGQGPHSVTYSSSGLKTTSLTVNGSATRTKTNYVNVIENPYLPPRQLAGTLQNGVNAQLNWRSPLINDGFENYFNFALSFGGYTQRDVDMSPTYSISGVNFPNQGYGGSFIVFNPSQTSPPLSGAWLPYEGHKYAACFAATTPPNNDWLITPRLRLVAGDHLSFYAKSITDIWGLERFRVAVSTTGTNPADFTTVLTANPYVQAPTTWTKYSYDLSAFAGQEIYVAINCVSNDAFVFMVDKLMIEQNPIKSHEPAIAESSNDASSPFLTKSKEAPILVLENESHQGKSFATYSVYRNGTLIGSTPGFSFVDSGLAPGQYTYTVRANYFNPNNQSGNSNQVFLRSVPFELGWTGLASNSWHNPLNWSPEFVPMELDNVTLPSNLTTYPNISAAVAINNLLLEDGATLLDNGHLTVHGTATVRRHIPRNGWHFLSAPVSGMNIIGSDFVPNSNPLPTTLDFYYWNETVGQQAGNWHPWINVRGVGGVPNTANFQQFVAGRGYLARYATGYTPANPFSFIGSLQTGTIGVIVNHSSASTAIQGWNLMGNPYPSAINWALADKTLFSDNFAYIYDPTLGGGGGGYHPESGLIAPHQGFFVKKATAGSATFNFTNAIRAHGGTWRKDEPVQDKIRLKLTRTDNNFYDETTLRVIEGSFFERDREDALKLFSFNAQMPQIFTQTADEVQVAINSIPAIPDGLEVWLGVLAPASGQYKLELIETSGTFTGTTAWLHNLKDGSTMNLSTNPAQEVFIASGTHDSHFKLTFAQPTNIGEVEEGAVSIHIWSSNLYLNFASEANQRQLRMFDTSGRQVFALELGQGTSYTVPLNLQSGIYVVQVLSLSGVVTQRVFVR